VALRAFVIICVGSWDPWCEDIERVFPTQPWAAAAKLMTWWWVWWQTAVKNVFIRGSVVRYIQIPAAEVDIPLLQEAGRKALQSSKGK
jgi:hypothetical protein